MVREWRGVLHTLVGLAGNKDGNREYFNFILSNGTRSTQRDGDLKYYDHMIPDNAINKIRSVTIYHNVCIGGFCFFDKDGALLWKIGDTHTDYYKETVLLEKNEVIVGVVAKLYIRYQSAYSDFQFQIASR